MAKIDIIIDEARLDHDQHIGNPLQGRVRPGFGAFQHQFDRIHVQYLGHIRPKIAQEFLELGGVQHAQNGAMHLIGARQVFISCRNYRAVGFFQPVKARFQPFHGQSAQVHDIRAHLALGSGDKGAHNVLVIQNKGRVRQDLRAKLFQLCAKGR